MPFATVPACRAAAVVDLGSNSVRLVVYEGCCRNPMAIFNEKAVLRLGRGLQATGRLNEDGVAQALTVHAPLRTRWRVRWAPHRSRCWRPPRCATRSNGPDFRRPAARRACRTCRSACCPAPRRREFRPTACCAASPTADGILADIGGGSLELVRLDPAAVRRRATLPLGVIRLAERAGNDPVRARAIAEDGTGRRAVADRRRGPRPLSGRRRLARAGAHPHGADRLPAAAWSTTTRSARDEARDLAGVIAGAGRRALERLPGVPRRRIDDLPFAAVVLRRLLRATGARRVVFSASGLREGWFMQPHAGRDPRPGPAARGRARHRAAARPRPDAAARAARLDRRRCSPTKPPRRGGCARPPAGCPISAATTIRSFAPSRRFCGCCASRASGWITTRAPSSR